MSKGKDETEKVAQVEGRNAERGEEITRDQEELDGKRKCGRDDKPPNPGNRLRVALNFERRTSRKRGWKKSAGLRRGGDMMERPCRSTNSRERHSECVPAASEIPEEKENTR